MNRTQRLSMEETLPATLAIQRSPELCGIRYEFRTARVPQCTHGGKSQEWPTISSEMAFVGDRSQHGIEMGLRGRLTAENQLLEHAGY